MTNIDIASELVVANRNPNGYTWTLASRLGKMLEKAESLFGERDKTFTVLGVEFTEGIPKVWYPGQWDGRKDILIQLSTHCLLDPIRAYFQLAHECIHLLSPIPGETATVLEEGIATFYSVAYLRDELGITFYQINEASYVDAKQKAKGLLNLDLYAIKKLREEEPTISHISKALILKHYPSLPEELAEQLTTPFDRDSDGTL